MNPFPLIRAGLRQNLASSLALIGLIALSVALCVSVSSAERSFRKAAARAGDAFDLLVAAPGSATQIVLSVVYLRPGTLELVPGGILEKLQKDPGVTFSAPVGFGDFHRGLPVVGTTPQFLHALSVTGITNGRAFSRWNEAVVGAGVKLPVGYRFRPGHGKHGDPDSDDDADGHGGPEHGVDLTVVGQMAATGTPWDSAILIPIETIWWAHSLPVGRVQANPDDWQIGEPFDAEPGPVPALVVKPKSVADAYRLRSAFRTKDTTAVFTGEVLTDLFRILGDVRDVLAAMTAMTQALVLAAVFPAMFTAMDQRRRTLGVLRALGASRTFIFSVLWGHVGAIVSAGAVCGMALGIVLTAILGAVARNRTGVDFAVLISPQDFGLAAILPLFALFAAILPVRRLCRAPVSDNLR